MSHFPNGVIGGVILLVAACSVANAQKTVLRGVTGNSAATGQTRELVCRGKPGIDLRIERDPSPRESDQVAMVLRYELPKEVRSVGQQGMGTIDYGRSVQFIPGSCTWGSSWPDVPREPGVVYFDLLRDAQGWAAPGARDTSIGAAEYYPDVSSLPRFLSDSTRYWVFFVDDASNVAVSHARWPLGGAAPPVAAASAGAPAAAFGKPLRPGATSAGASGTRASAGASPTSSVAKAPVAGSNTVDSSASSVAFDPYAVRGIVITPSVNGVQMKFEGPTVLPLVQVSTLPPFQEPRTGRWMFSPQHVPLSVARDATAGQNAYTAATTGTLSQNTEYHYIINAPKPSGTSGTLNLRRRPGGDRQAVGTFRTLRTLVTVRIDKVRVINDSDAGSNGDLAFRFSVNGTRMFEAGTALAEVSPGSTLDLTDGATYDFSRNFDHGEVRNHLRIHAAGFDNDGAAGGEFDTSWDAAPGGDGGGDWNHARAEFFLDRYPGRSFSFPFRMRTGPGSTLQFEVEGRVIVTRD